MIFIVWLVVGGICAMISASMAGARNKQPGVWGALGFFFGLIPILILAFEKPNGSDSDGEILRDGRSQDDISSGKRSKKPIPLPMYDNARWEALKDVDPTVETAALKMSALGKQYEAELAYKFLALNDVSILPALVRKIEIRASEELTKSRNNESFEYDLNNQMTEQEEMEYLEREKQRALRSMGLK